MRIFVWILLVVSMQLVFVGITYAGAAGKVTARVIDENGIPIQGAEAEVSFKFAKAGGIGLDTKAEQGITDKDGLFTAIGQGMASISLFAKKEGYYMSGRGYEFKTSTLSIRWEPWNPTIEVVLKKKRNPVPMYSKNNESLKMPLVGKPVGYDLEKGDWVAPYGIGMISDFIFTFSSVDRAWTDYECGYTLSFTNNKDGLQEYSFDADNQSSYKWPFGAPEGGYQSVLQKERHDTQKTGLVTNAKENTNYLFRVRTKTDKQGNIVEALYGKIEGEINVWPGKVRFYYHLNPDGTRNLEEDPKKNLFKR